MLSGDGLRLSDEPLEGLLAALLLQLLPDHIPAHLVVVVEPVALQEGERQTDAACSPSHLYPRLRRQTGRAPRVESTRRESNSFTCSWTTSLCAISLDTGGTRPRLW